MKAFNGNGVIRLLRQAGTPVRYYEGMALFLILLAAMLGFVSAAAAGQVREGSSPAAAIAAALPIPVFAVLAFVFVHLVLRLRGLELEETLLPVVALLTTIGLVMIWRLRGQAGALQQARSLFIGLGVAAALVARPRWVDAIRRWAVPISLSGLALSFLTAVFGVQDESGARLALKLGPLPSIQTTEFIKVALIIFLAWFADKEVRAVEGRSRLVLGWLRLPPLRYFLPGAVFISMATLALALMSDYGAVLILLCLFVGVLYCAFETRIFATLVGIGAAMAIPVGLILAAVWKVPDVMRYRYLAFLDPWSSQPVILNGQAAGITISEGPGYQIQQAIYAIAAGGITGKGLGFGSPGFIPLAHSDFIFASILEELGAVTGLAVLALYAILVLRLFRAAALLPSGQVFERILAAGIGIHLITQVLVMVGGTLNLLPMTGVTLPFLSQGGTALMVNLIETGVVLSLLQRVEMRPV